MNLIEVRVEHAMGRDKIGCSPVGERAPRAERDIIPKAVDNDRVITFRVFLEPGNKMRRVTIAQPRNYSAPSTIARVADAHGVELDGHGPRPRIERRIERISR